MQESLILATNGSVVAIQGVSVITVCSRRPEDRLRDSWTMFASAAPLEQVLAVMGKE